ncbi:uncharacterized protein PF3D7_1120600-like [Condylostylus longicornis]|uniref:uncharacterized protein PF3D7_1120600-like n=1 Tax=Condylostylus longicornis TaxID=2530218 RepID=UPI00244E51C3|nr:uncharacterized protein PF3D7_1120600-like [Condylostylus longicornis]
MSESGDYDNIASDDDLKPDLIVREIDFAEEYTPEDDKEHRIAPNQKHPHSKWHDEINKKLRLLIKSEITQDNFKFHYGSYLTSLKEHLPFLLRNPKHCRQVAKKMSRTLLLFRSLYSNTTEIDLYHTKMCELLSILTTLELTYASNFDELKIEIVKRLCTNYDIHLRNLDATHILTVFLYLYSYYISNMKQKKGWTIFDQTEILTKIFEKYLKKFPNIKQTKLNDKLYCMYIAAYSFWINIENDVYEKNNIIRYANQVIAPKPSLRLNKTYFQYLAKYPPDEQNVTKFIFDRGINRAGLVKILIEEDNCKDIIINVEWGETQHPVIDLDEDLAGKSFENLTLTEEVKFKPVGQPSVVATIDLTDDKMDEDDARNCPWLDKLIKLTRQARKSRRCQNKNSSNIEIINLDSDNDYEEYEENEEDKENEESKQHTESEKENENHYDKQSRTDELITEPNKQAEIYTAQNTEGNADERVNNKTVVQKDCVTSEENEHKKEKKNSNDNYLDGKISKTNTINQETETIAKIVEEERGQSINSCDENKKEQNKSNKTPARENESQICSVEVFQKDTITQTTEEGVQSSSVEEGKEKTSEDKGEAVLTHADLDKSISSSSNQATEDEILAGFVPIFDENLTFVTNYVTKTYSNKQTVKNLQNDSNNIEDSETHSEINDKEGNSKQNKEISNECNYEITSSTLLNDDYESENNNLKSACSNKQRKVNPEKIVHRFIATKKVNFAPLPEKHIPKKPVKYSSINQMRRNSISIDKIQNSFIPPPGTEAFKLYETQKDSSLVKDSSNNLQTQNNTQNSNDLSHVAGSIEKSIQTSNVNNFGVSSPTKTNITSESRPTAEAILAATIHKTSGHGDISDGQFHFNQCKRLVEKTGNPSQCLNTSNIVINDSDKNYDEGKENEESGQFIESEKQNENDCDKQNKIDALVPEQRKNSKIDTEQNFIFREMTINKQVMDKNFTQEEFFTSKENEQEAQTNKSNNNYPEVQFNEPNIIHQETEDFEEIVGKDKNPLKGNINENCTEQNKINKTLNVEYQNQYSSIDAFQNDIISEAIHKEKNKEKLVLAHGHLEELLISSQHIDVEEAEYVPIFDENLSFVTNYVTKTYSKKQIVKNNNNNLNNIEENRTHAERNYEEANNEQYTGISNECNYEITSSTILNDEYETEKNNRKSACSYKEREVNKEKLLHSSSVPKKVNFAPLPEKHVSKNPVKYTSMKRMRRNSVCIDKVQNFLIPPTNTEAFELYESRNSIAKNVSNNLPSLNNSQQLRNLHVAGSIEKSMQIPDKRSTSPFVTFNAASPTKANINVESRPTAEAMLAATIHKTPGNANISGTPYIINQHSPNNFLEIDRFTQQPRYQSKPNFYDYSLTKKPNNPMNLKHGYHSENSKPMSDFDLYLLKLRESKKEANKQLKKERRMMKREKRIEKMQKELKKSFQKSKAKRKKLNIINDILTSPKQLQVLIKRVDTPLTKKVNVISENESLENTSRRSLYDDFTQKESVENNLPNEAIAFNQNTETNINTDSAINNKNENSEFEVNKSHPPVTEENYELKEKVMQIKNTFQNNGSLSKQKITDSVKSKIKKRGRKRIQNEKVNPEEISKINNINKMSLGNENNCNNFNISFETLQDIVEKITNPSENNELNKHEENKNLSHHKRKFVSRQFVIKVKRLTFSKQNSDIVANNSEEVITVHCTSENTNLSNLKPNDSQEINIQKEPEMVLSENENSSQLNHQETNGIIDSNNENVTVNTNNDDIVLNSGPRTTDTPYEIHVMNNITNNNDTSNLIEHNVNDSNLVLNDNNSKENDTLGKNKDSTSQAAFKSSPKSDSYLVRKCYDNELESIFKIKENEVTSTQESEVSSSLDLQSPITKRRKSRKSSLQDNEIPYSKDFALDCDDTASNAPTTTTIIDFVIANKKKRTKQKKFDTTIPNDSIVDTIDQIKLTTNKNIMGVTKNLQSKNVKNHIRKLNKTNVKGARRTYSKNNIVSTVFVPPDIEEMIHKDVEIQEIPKLRLKKYRNKQL